MKLLIKYPTRARPDTFKSTLQLYVNKLSGKHDVEFVITMDTDDPAMNNPEMHAFLDRQKNMCYCYGENHSKIEAINANMQGHTFDVLLLASDDMIPETDGYDDIICSHMQQTFPELDGALHFNDGRAGQNLITLSIMGKKMYDQFGYIYHSDYKSLFCDNEFHDVVYKMGKVKWIDQVIIRHAWVDVTGQDSLHHHNEGYHHADRQTYERRKAAGFPKESVGARVPLRERDPRRRVNSSTSWRAMRRRP